MKNYKLKINGNDYSVDINKVEGQEMTLAVNGKEYVVTLEQDVKPQPVKPAVAPRKQEAPAAAPKAAAPAGSKVQSPLPGTIMDVLVNVGDAVKAGQTLLVLEAMKMENNIEADTDGVVKEVKVRKGDSVMEGDALVIIG